MRINRKRLENSMAALGRVGETAKGGLNRLALTDDDRRGRDLLVRWMREAGLTVTVDQMGNIFGLRGVRGPLPPVRLGDALERIGYLGPEPCVPRPIRAYLELHIEQGPMLEEEGLSVGVVEGIVAISWSRVTFHGVQDHAGPTPMRMRHDALVAAADVVRGVREIPRRLGGDLVATVGRLDVTPNITNAIPGRVSLAVDLRDPQDANLDRALALLDRVIQEAARSEGVRHEVEHYWRVPRTPFHPEVVGTIEAAARSLGCGQRRILSGAGHDAQYMAAICPTGMIFVPSRGGRSHCEEEFTPMDDIEHGANTLFLAALDLAGRADLAPPLVR